MLLQPSQFTALIGFVAFLAIAPAEAQRGPVLGDEFQLGHGKTIAVGGLSVRFDAVEGDSRCPTDVQCITAGDAVVVLTLKSGRAAAVRHRLHTGGEPSEESYEGFKTTLVRLDPAPQSTKRIASSQYIVTLRVTR